MTLPTAVLKRQVVPVASRIKKDFPAWGRSKSGE